MTWEALDRLIASATEDTKRAYTFAVRQTLAPDVLAEVPATGPKRVDISDADFRAFVEAGYLNPMADAPRLHVELFTTPEKCDDQGRPTRRRLVNWPVDINGHQKDVTEMELASRKNILDGCLLDGAMLFDIEAMYMHFPLPLESCCFYGVTHAGKHWTLGAIPTGGRHCPAIAQAVSDTIARLAVRNLPNVHVSVYIDNFRFAGSQLDCELAAQELRDICRELGFALSGGDAFLKRYIFLGIDCDHEKAEIRAAPKALKKLESAAENIFKQERPTVLEGLKLLGSLMWVSGVADVSIGDFYIALKFFRRRGCASTLESPLAVWPCAVKNIRFWISTALANAPRKIARHASHEVSIYSDACLSGWGGVCIDAGVVSVICGAWDDHQRSSHINALEGCALLIVVARFVDKNAQAWLTTPTRIKIFVDNTTVLGSVQRGYSPTLWANQTATAVCNILRPFTDWQIRWVASSEMVADSASRALTREMFPNNNVFNNVLEASTVGNGTGGDA